jgi:3-oxoacyl-[acyl-carrier protein] reductase
LANRARERIIDEIVKFQGGVKAVELKDKCALVTGSSRGIGKAIALILAKHGANVAVNYVEDKERKNFNDAKNVAGQIACYSNKVAVFGSDVSDFESVFRMVKEIMNLKRLPN